MARLVVESGSTVIDGVQSLGFLRVGGAPPSPAAQRQYTDYAATRGLTENDSKRIVSSLRFLQVRGILEGSMSQQLGGASLKAKRALTDSVFSEYDPGGIFVTAFRWLLSHSDYVDVILADSRLQVVKRKGDAGPDEPPLLRESDAYHAAREAVASCLNPGPEEQTAAERGRISDEALIEARDAFWSHLRRSSGLFELVAITLGLLDAIESRVASALVTTFREQRSHESPSTVPLAPTRILPKPKAGFGTGIVDSDRFPPMVDLPDEAIVLREYFGRLAVTPSAVFDTQAPTPALHAHWSGGIATREDPRWRVAMLSILADLGDVAWRPEGGRFRGCELANKRVRNRLDWALRQCEQLEPDVIVIPELNIDREAKETLQAWLRADPRGPDQTSPVVIYGGLHQADPDKEGKYRNQPGLLTPSREMQWDYWKRFPVRGKLEVGGDPVLENLGAWPPHVLGIDLPIGRVAVLICKDFLMAETRTAVQQLLPTVLIVPAMTSSDSVENFQAHAKTFASSLRCVTLFCNSSVYQRSPWRDSQSAAPRTLGILHSNTKKRSYSRPPSHELDSDETRAVVGVYTLTATEKGLEVTTEEKYLTRGEEDALAALSP